VPVRIKLGSARRGLRVASPFANRIRNWDILGSLDAWVGWAPGCGQPGKLPLDVIRHHLHYTGSAPLITAVTSGSTGRAEVPAPGHPDAWEVLLEWLQIHAPGSAMATGERGCGPKIAPSIRATSRTGG
jgi:hypothetical protein